MIVSLSKGIVVFGVDTFTGVCITVVLCVVAFEVLVPASYTTPLRTAVMIDVSGVTVISVASRISVDALADVDVYLRTALESISMMPS